MNKKLTVLTATRAEYGLLKNLILALEKAEEFVVEVVVTGAHLSAGQGYTYREIEKDGIHIAKKIEILMDADSPSAVSKSMGLALIGFAEYFEESDPDALLVLGDRYETLAVCCAAMNARIPIIHLYGGDTTEGAVDEAIRHSITKMSYLHLTSTEEYRRRVIQLGEDPSRVCCVGAIGVENAIKEEKLSKEELAEAVGLDLSVPFGVVTFHPVTLEGNAEWQCGEVLAAIAQFPQYQFIITGANADSGGTQINRMFSEFAIDHDNVVYHVSLGMKKYLSALKYASFLLGNSSSGLVEGPAFHIPSVNIGNRQKGRIRAVSVIDCPTEQQAISDAVRQAMTPKFRKSIEFMRNPYGDGNSIERIVEILKERIAGSDIDIRKSFYNLPFSILEESGRFSKYTR